MSVSRRSQPLTTAEKHLFFEVLKPFMLIIANKKTDSTTVQKKTAAWKKIASIFSSKPLVTPRSFEQLKRYWENVRTKRKKEEAAVGRSAKLTGGGPPGPMVSDDPELDMLLSQTGIHIQIENIWDSDGASLEPSQGCSKEADDFSLIYSPEPHTDDDPEEDTEEVSEVDNKVPTASPAAPVLQTARTSAPNARTSASTSRTSTAPSSGSASALADEHARRMEKLDTEMRNQEEIHCLRRKEAQLLVEAANFRKAREKARKHEAEISAETAALRKEEAAAAAEIAKLELEHLQEMYSRT